MNTTTQRNNVLVWWGMLLAGAAATLLFAWLGRLAGVPLSTLLSIGAGGIALAWLIVLVTVPWNLHFAARAAVADLAVSRERGIAVRPDSGTEARRIARRMLWFALGAHLGTAAVVAVIAYFSGVTVGYYFAGFYLLSTAIRPAVAYFGHVRERIRTLGRESRHPRDDVATLKQRVDGVTGTLKELRAELGRMSEGARRTQSTLTDDIAHARQVLTADLARVQEAQDADRSAARTRADDLGRRIDQMVRQIEATLDGISDHQDLLTGIRALVRMIKPIS
jgi:hypothetical protein